MPTKSTPDITRQQWLSDVIKLLTSAGIDSARLDALIFLEDVTKINRSVLLAHLDEVLNSTEIEKLSKKVKRRLQHEPIAYIRSEVPFYGRTFKINSHALIPRPETETMIELLKKLPLNKTTRLADAGTGSGILGISAALELPSVEVHLYDIDSSALALAESNAKLHGVQVQTFERDLFANVNEPYDVILANLPYVPDNYAINKPAEHEPALAIFGGPDGLELYRRFFGQLRARKRQPAFLLTEALNFQHEALCVIASGAGFSQRKSEGLIQVWEPIAPERRLA